MLDGPMIDIDFPRCGFDYDDSSDDYKILGVVFKLSINEDEIRELTLRRVYSLKTNSWKTMMVDMDTDVFVGASGVVEEAGKFDCGNLHWNKTHRGLDSCITRFDLKTEVYGEVEKPAHSKDSFCDNVGVLEGCLSFVRCNRNSELGVWVMTEYGVKESWVKLATVPSICHCSELKLLRPYGWGPYGRILLVGGSTFIVCRTENDVLQHPWRIDFIGLVWNADLYTQSLVSLLKLSKRGKNDFNHQDKILSYTTS